MPFKLVVMAPKIHPIQHLRDGTITGPIGDEWDADVAGVVFTVVVSQVIGDTNPKVATAIGWSEEAYTTNGGGDWSATLYALSLRLEEGDATVAAWATIAMKDGGSETYEWTLPVKIVA